MDRYATGPRSSGATFWIPGVKTEKTAKKRRKNEQKWARYSHLKRVRAALLWLRNRYECDAFDGTEVGRQLASSAGGMDVLRRYASGKGWYERPEASVAG